MSDDFRVTIARALGLLDTTVTCPYCGDSGTLTACMNYWPSENPGVVTLTVAHRRPGGYRLNALPYDELHPWDA